MSNQLVNEIRTFVNGHLQSVFDTAPDLAQKYLGMGLIGQLLDLADAIAERDGVRTELVGYLAECHRPYAKALELLDNFDIHPKP